MLMVLLLAISMAMALTFTTHSLRAAANGRQYNASEVTIGPARFHLPDGWEPVEHLPADTRFGNAMTMLINRDHAGQVLTLALLPGRNMRSPQVALREAVDLVREKKSTAATADEMPAGHPFRSKTAVGMITSLAPAELEEMLIEQIAVVTDDGRTYGMLHLVSVRAQQETHALNRAMLRQSNILALASSVTFKELALASGEQLSAAGLAELPSMRSPVGFFASSNADEPAIHILPSQGPAGLWLARIRGVSLPADAFDPQMQENQPFSASVLLKRASPVTVGEGETVSPPTPVEFARLRGWKIIHTGRAEEVGLQRELWLVTSRDREGPTSGGILVELITEPRIAHQAQSLVVSTLQSLQPVDAMRDPSHWRAAMERGKTAASALRDGYADRLSVSPQYWGFYCEGLPLGFVLSQVTTQATPPLTVRGRTLLVHTAVQRFLREEIWSSDKEASRGWMVSRMVVPAGDAKSGKVQQATRLEMGDGKLAQYDLLNPPASSSTDVSTVPREDRLKWSVTLEPNHLPWMTLDAWPMQLLQTWRAGEGAVVWFTAGSQPPEPMWMEISVDQPQGWRVTLRPLAEMKPYSLRLDERGQVYGAQWYNTVAGALLPLQFNTQQVDRKAITSTYESMEDDIQRWEKEWLPHETFEQEKSPVSQ